MNYRLPSDPAEPFKMAAILARPLALGFLTWAEVKACLAVQVAKHTPKEHQHADSVLMRACWQASANASAADRSRRWAERHIASTVFPLCRQRCPGDEILAAAMKANDGVMRRDEVLEVCRQIAAQTRRGPLRGR